MLGPTIAGSGRPIRATPRQAAPMVSYLWQVHAGPNSFSCPGDMTPRSLAARTATINTFFVCSAAGSLVPPDAFGCVEAIQPFPGEAEDGYEPNRAFHPGF
jgi:hypothetical protein